MKYLIAIIQPDKMHEVLSHLESWGIYSVTISLVLGRGRQKGVSAVYRSIKETGKLLQKIKLEIFLPEKHVPIAIKAISESARSDSLGDGKIFILDMQQWIRIRTSENSETPIPLIELMRNQLSSV